MLTKDELLNAAASALRSYQFGNSSPELAKDIAGAIDAALGHPNSAMFENSRAINAALDQVLRRDIVPSTAHTLDPGAAWKEPYDDLSPGRKARIERALERAETILHRVARGYSVKHLQDDVDAYARS